MKIKKIFTLLLMASTLLLNRMAYADPNTPEQVWHIVIVVPRPINITEMAMQEFLKNKALNIHYSILRYHVGQETPHSLNARIRALKPNVIYTWGTPTTLAVAGPFDAPKNSPYIRDIPIVFNTVTDPVASRLVPTLTNQRRNLTGVIHIASLLTQLNTMKAYRPFKHIGHIYNPLELNSVNISRDLQKLSVSYPFHYTALPVPIIHQKPDAEAIPHLVTQLAKAEVDILYLGPDTFISLENREIITEAALNAKIPAFSSVEEPVRTAKALFGLYTTNISSGRFAAFKIAQILKDHTPVNRIPLETLRDFTLLINMPVAQELNDYPPLPLLEIADTINAEPLS